MSRIPAARIERELAGALSSVDRLPTDAAAWERLVRTAREANLLGTLAERVYAQNAFDRVPRAPRAHFVAARATAKAQEAAAKREIAEIGYALRDVRVPVILLKGAAYLAAGLPAARGRMFSDIDILVPKHALPRVESALMLAGYATTHLDPYDQRYYRKWRHELPPMQHVKRLSIVDVHHTILAELSGGQIDVDALFRDSRPLAAYPRFHVLAPADMVLHSAMHLFRNEDMTHAYRDLVDLDVLLRHFASDAFWRALPTRAELLHLGRSLYYALRWTTRLFATPVPAAVSSAIAVHAPPMPIRIAMDAILDRALRPQVRDPGTRWARGAVYVRGHWLRLPMPLLAWHLTMKAFRRDEQSA
jgi:hypothetical protein